MRTPPDDTAELALSHAAAGVGHGQTDVALASVGWWRVASAKLRLGQLAQPLLVVAIVLLASGWLSYFRLNYGMHPGLAGYAQINAITAQRLHMRGQAIDNPTGYDGQYYYFLAMRPDMVALCAQHASACAMTPTQWPELRAQRILYPIVVRMVALAQPDFIPFALLLVNFLAILITVFLVGQMSIEAGASPWLGAAAGLFCGEALGFLRDLADPFSVMWLVLAVWCLTRSRYVLAAGAIAAALLTREPLIFSVPFLFLPLVAQRRWWRLAQCLALALGPFILWQVILKLLYGSWALLTSDSTAAQLVPIPFAGLVEAQFHQGRDFGALLLFVVAPLIAAIAIAALAMRRGGWRGVLRDPVPLVALAYCALLSVTYWFQWADIWGPPRLATPGIVLAVIVVARLRMPKIQAGFGALVAASTICTFLIASR